MGGEKRPADADWKLLRNNVLDRIWCAGSGYNTYECACIAVVCRRAPYMYPPLELIAAQAQCCVRTAAKAMKVACPRVLGCQISHSSPAFIGFLNQTVIPGGIGL